MSRELDALVAEKVMGWNIEAIYVGDNNEMLSHHVVTPPMPVRTKSGVEGARFTCWNETWVEDCYIPKYTADPSADYEVLKHVRDNWAKNELEIDQFDTFLKELGKIWDNRSLMAAGYGTHHELVRFYEPGDYSKAALKALGVEIT